MENNLIKSTTGTETGQNPVQPSENQVSPGSLINSVPMPDPSKQPALVSPSHDATSAQAQPGDNKFITGSQFLPEKKKLPLGVYIIAGFSFLGFMAGFFDSSQNSIFYTLAMFLNLLLAVGLIARLEAARKLLVILSGITVVLAIGSCLLLAGLQRRLGDRKAEFETAISKLDRGRVNLRQQEQIDDLRILIRTEEKRVGRAITFTYIKLSLTAVESVAVIIYLKRPNVKEAFRTLDAPKPI